METDLTAMEQGYLRRKARIPDGNPWETMMSWWRKGLEDFRAHRGVGMAYGIGLFIVGWAILLGLGLSGFGWLILPTIAGGMLLGPLATVDLYRISRRAQGKGGTGVAAPRQIFLVSVVMMVLLLAWIRAATLLFAVFYGLHPFAGFFDILLQLFNSFSGIMLLLTGSAVGGLFAAFGFAISAFSFPMLVHRNIDGFSAMALSFNATTQNFRLVVTWAAFVTALTFVGVMTGLLAMIPLFPILGFATWHAYWDLFQE